MIQNIFEYPFLMRIFNKLLTDKEKLNLIVNKFIYDNKHRLKFNEQHYIHSMNGNEWYFNCLTNIKIDHLFNMVIPSSVTHLTFGENFDTSIENCIPDSVTYLTLGEGHSPKLDISIFNQEIKGNLPRNLIYLYLGSNFRKSINCLTENCPFLEHLELAPSYYEKINSLPNSLKYLTCSGMFYKINKHVINEKIKIKYVYQFYYG